jgi:Ca2+:H+ antiporter
MPRWMYTLLLALPATFIAEALHATPVLVFLLAALALVPLAGLIGLATEALAERLNYTLGGLLNATFGNAAELIIGITALSAGLTQVVLASITGSIIGNVLLVLGMSMLAGGWRHGAQVFSKANAGHYAVMMTIAVVGMTLPSLIALVGEGTGPNPALVRGLALHELSLAVGVLLLASYVAYVGFSIFGLGAHGRQPATGADAALTPLEKVTVVEEIEGASQQPHSGDVSVGGGATPEGAVGEEKTTPSMAHSETGLLARVEALWRRGPAVPVATLALVTALTAIVSEALVGAIEPVAEQIGLNPFFIGLIILPIIGNAAEHSSAITFALRNRMEVSMAITAGSSIQVALLVTPVLVFISWVVGHPLDLLFAPFELVVLALVTGIFALVSLDGESTWIEGMQLCVFYLIVALCLFFVPA